MAIITFDPVLFRSQFPSFTVAAGFTDAIIEAQWDIATCYINNQEACSILGGCLAFAINAMTAHLLQLGVNSGIQAPGGNATGNVTSATIDKVSVNIEAPPTITSQFHYWLNKTSYGQQLLALLKVKSIGGLYVGGLPEKSAFRKVGGVF